MVDIFQKHLILSNIFPTFNQMKKLLPLLLLILIGCSKDDGPYEDYYPNGKVRGDGTFKNNKVEGLLSLIHI